VATEKPTHCVKCRKAPPQPNRKMCAGCAERRRQTVRAYQTRRKARGPDPAAPKATDDMAAYKRAWRASRRVGSNCTTCGGPRDVEGKVRCSACHARDKADYKRIGRTRYQGRAEQVNGELKAKRIAWAEAGLCNWCGGARNVEGRKRCRACLVYVRRQLRAQADRRRAVGLCPKCGKRPPAATKATCEPCLEQQRRCFRRLMLTNPSKALAQWHRRRAQLSGNGGSFTAEEWEAIKATQDYRCLACGRREPEIKLTVDHIIPVAMGGPSFAWNLQGLCDCCNKRKGAKHIDLRPTD
jgi:hypothetical protein